MIGQFSRVGEQGKGPESPALPRYVSPLSSQPAPPMKTHGRTNLQFKCEPHHVAEGRKAGWLHKAVAWCKGTKRRPNHVHTCRLHVDQNAQKKNKNLHQTPTVLRGIADRDVVWVHTSDNFDIAEHCAVYLIVT